MNTRFVLAACGALLLLTACPPTETDPDAGTDSGVPVTGTCTEVCQGFEKCDLETRQCVPGCDQCDGTGVCVNGCPSGLTCTGDGTSFECQEVATTCNGVVCGPGQTACISGKCSCLTERASGGDTCGAQGKFCEALYNQVSDTGGNCRLPTLWEECLNNPGCGDGLLCSGGLCQRPCGTGGLDPMGTCGPDEVCNASPTLPDVCYWSGLFISSNRFEGCLGLVPNSADGGWVQNGDGTYQTQAVPIATSCLPFQTVASPDNQIGTCNPVTLRNVDSSFNYTNCKRPGSVALGGRCLLDDSSTSEPTTCGQGLTCVPRAGANGFIDAADEGICAPVCNATAPIGDFDPAPSCAAGSACVNYRRETERLAVLGGCAETCNVFSADANFGCPTGGPVAYACVPVPPGGDTILSVDGSGVCLPTADLTGSFASEGQSCAVTDPFQGASCASGLVCVPGAGQGGNCQKPCDLECSGANPPARCASLQNATCSGGRTCTALSTDPRALTGTCQ